MRVATEEMFHNTPSMKTDNSMPFGDVEEAEPDSVTYYHSQFWQNKIGFENIVLVTNLGLKYWTLTSLQLLTTHSPLKPPSQIDIQKMTGISLPICLSLKLFYLN